MKHLNRYHLAMVPLLTLLAMSPTVLETQFPSRSIASVVNEEVKGHPKYEAFLTKIDQSTLKQDPEITLEKFKGKLDEVKTKFSKERENFKKEQSDKSLVEEQKKKAEELVVDILLLEGDLKILKEKQLIEQADDEASVKVIIETKDVAESILVDLEANEALVAKANEVVEEPKKDEEVPVVAEEPVVTPEPQTPVAPTPTPVVAEDKKDEEDKKEKEKCEAEEQNKVLTAQVEKLIEQQNQIMQTMLSMTQMMLQMQQQQMPNPYYANGGFQMPNPYQYQQPFSSGNWVYYPPGFQPNQGNIFQQPQQPYQQPYQRGFYTGDEGYQQQPNNWQLQPSYNFDPRYQTTQIAPGSFGSDAFSYNMGISMNNSPVLSQTF